MKLTTTAAAIFLSASAASAVTVDFDGADHGDFLENGMFDFGGGLTGQVLTLRNSGTWSDRNLVEGVAQFFDTSEEDTEDPDLEFPNADLGNVLIVNENRRRADDNWSGGIITFIFDQLVNFEGVTLVDLEEDQPVRITTDGGTTGPLFNGDNQFSSYFASGDPTNVLSFNFRGSGAIDNLELTISEVPLPFSGLLLLGGLGALGLQRRKKA